MNITAIETEYKGYKFRSRLEARWAIFFDTLGVKWEYEPEGFTLPDGKHYLPDFRVRCYGTRGDYDREPFDLYIEVKGVRNREDDHKMWEFSQSHPLLVVESIPNFQSPTDCVESGYTDSYRDIDVPAFNYITVDGDWFAAYPAAHEGKFYLMGDDCNYINNDDLPAVYAAYISARQARFEHGEQPDIDRFSMEKKTKRVQLVFQPTLHEWALKEAEKLGISLNEYIHRLIREKKRVAR